MRLKDVPTAPAYLVFHDAYDHGAMDVWAQASLETAEAKALDRNAYLESVGEDGAGVWKAYAKLPRVRVWKFHPMQTGAAR